MNSGVKDRKLTPNVEKELEGEQKESSWTNRNSSYVMLYAEPVFRAQEVLKFEFLSREELEEEWKCVLQIAAICFSNAFLDCAFIVIYTLCHVGLPTILTSNILYEKIGKFDLNFI
jgi:hypothetical protein